MAAEELKPESRDELVLVETRPDWTRWVRRSDVRPEWKILEKSNQAEL